MVEWLEGAASSIAVPLVLLAVVFLISGLDDLLMSVFFVVWRVYRRLVFQPAHQRLTRERLLAEPQKPIAVMVPTWQEVAVIRKTLSDAIQHLQYAHYRIFVGVYPNDPQTRAEVEAVARLHPRRICVVDVGHPGPTSKDDCLNAVVNHVLALDQSDGGPYEIFVVDDAEDVVPRDALLVFNHLIPRIDLVQLPIFPTKAPWWQFTAGHYMDEFALLHLKDMRTREWLTGTLPCAGAGMAMSRRTLELARSLHQGQPFSDRTLTEDYELPLELAPLRVRSAFIDPTEPILREGAQGRPVRAVAEDFPYLRSDFPSNFWSAVRQKTRWVLGIALQGWQDLGWRGTLPQVYMLWRDRKPLVGNLANLAGYVLVLAILALWLLQWALTGNTAMPQVVASDSWIWSLLVVNLYLMLALLLTRMLCTYKIYGPLHALLSVPRAVWGNFINFVATARALWQFFRARRPGGTPITWDKTEHEAPR
jgi:bacteriophage N4 adsorption protein B